MMAEDPLRQSLSRRRRQRREGPAEERTFFRSLAVIGTLGWMIVLPTLGGLAFGRWLDGRFASGIFWTGTMLFVGLAIGCRLAWNRMHRP